MSHGWRSKQELILVQIWVVLLLSHIVYAQRSRIATAANCEPFEVSVPLLVKLLPQLCSNCELQFERLVQEGRHLGLLRASPHLALMVPQVELSSYRPAPPELPGPRPGHAPTAPRARRLSRPHARRAIGCSDRGVKRPKRQRQSERPKRKPPRSLSC
jgi:hypothetical protein